MADPAPPTYAESLRQVTAAFAAHQAQGLVGLHAPVGPITVSWGEWVSDTVLDVGGFGRGVDGQGWAEWLACCPPAAHPWLEALRADIVARGICCSGPDHQHDMCPSMRDEGHPDLVVHATFSHQGWGGMIAAIWNSENPENQCSYADFAFLVFEGPLRADGSRVTPP